VRSIVDAHAHTLSLRLPQESLRVEADLVRLTQVFINLLTNAAKYTPDGGTIDVELDTDPTRDGWAVVHVRDSGAGIPPQMLERVFDLFAQANPAETRTQSGLGIGLSLVRGLVELHGGVVEALSEGVGRGSEFVVRLPLLTSELAEGAQQPGPEVLAALPPLRLLIIDDNADTATGLALHLRENGNHVVRLAPNGQMGLAAAREFGPEVVLLDIGLPDIDGYEVARQLRADERFRGLPVIALTGFGGEPDRKRAERAGFGGFLVKPVPYAALAAMLAEHVGARAGRHAAALS
jgi:CheY-like chemotaxis protein